MIKRAMGLMASVVLTSAGAAAAAPEVVVSIKPIHSLVAGVMKGVGEPKLIVEGAASPHTYSMRPSNARAVQNADVVFWVGPSMEAFLDKPLDALGGKAMVVALQDAPGLEKLPFREGGAFEAHDDEAHGDEDAHAHEETAEAGNDHHHEQHAGHDHSGHSHEGFDTHLWLDPENAKAMVKEIEARLAAADPANVAAYSENAMAMLKRIDALDADIAARIAPVKEKPFVVFHDAYQYFEHHYGVRVAGSVTVSPETAPGAERLREIQAKIVSLGATCVFAEPQFTPKLINVVTEGTKASNGVLDPEGATLTEGPDLYFELMNNLSSSLVDCLGKES